MAPSVYMIPTPSSIPASDLVPPRAEDLAQPVRMGRRRAQLAGRSAVYDAGDQQLTQQKRHLHARSNDIAVLSGLVTGDEHVKLLHRRATLEPNDTQKVTLGVIGAYIALIIVLWNIPYLKYVLWPFKMLTIAMHEFSHAFVGLITGAKIKSITLDPREGGCTMMAGGVGWLTLPAGYLGSSLIGAALIVCGFDTIASKVCSLVLGAGFLITLWWARRDWLTIVTVLLATALLIACWFIAHGAALRYFVLFVGVLSATYSVWDICDDLILRKVNESDASVFAKRYGGSSQCYGVIFGILSLASLIGGILVGLVVFKETFSEQNASSASFLPTRLI